jgi:hypothetical protein
MAVEDYPSDSKLAFSSAEKEESKAELIETFMPKLQKDNEEKKIDSEMRPEMTVADFKINNLISSKKIEASVLSSDEDLDSDDGQINTKN